MKLLILSILIVILLAMLGSSESISVGGKDIIVSDVGGSLFFIKGAAYLNISLKAIMNNTNLQDLSTITAWDISCNQYNFSENATNHNGDCKFGFNVSIPNNNQGKNFAKKWAGIQVNTQSNKQLERRGKKLCHISKVKKGFPLGTQDAICIDFKDLYNSIKGDKRPFKRVIIVNETYNYTKRILGFSEKTTADGYTASLNLFFLFEETKTLNNYTYNESGDIIDGIEWNETFSYNQYERGKEYFFDPTLSVETQANWDEGTYVSTEATNGILMLQDNASGQYNASGYYESKVFDAGETANWTRISPRALAGEIQHKQAVPDYGSNVLVHLKFDNNSLYGESNTFAYDYSGNGNNGTCTGAACPTLVTGQIDSGYSFDGGDQFELAANASSLDFNCDTDNFTMMAWIKVTSGNTGTIIGKRSSNQQYQMYVDTTLIGWCGGVQLSTGVTVDDGEWHHVVMRNLQNGTNNNFWASIDGVEDDTIINPSTAKDSTTTRIGDHAGGYALTGSIDEVVILDRVVTNAEIETIYDLTKNKYTAEPMNMSDIISVWHFNNDSNIGENDSKVVDVFNGNNLTIVDATYTDDGKIFGAYNFDGSNDYMTITDSDYSTDNFSISAWVYINKINTGDQNDVFGRYTSGTYPRHFIYGFNTDSTYYIVYGTSVFCSGNQLVDSTFRAPTVGEWHHIVWVANSSAQNTIVYEDGVNVYNVDWGGNICSTNADSVIGVGSKGDASEHLNGSIDEVVWFNRVITGDEVTQLYQRGLTRMNLSGRTCDDSACSGESYTRLDNGDEPTYYPVDIPLDNNQYFQYKIDLSTENTTYTPTVEDLVIEYFEAETSAASLTMEYVNPTPPHLADGINSSIPGNASINVSLINAGSLSTVTFDWNDTNHTVMNHNLIAYFNFNEHSSLSESGSTARSLSPYGITAELRSNKSGINYTAHVGWGKSINISITEIDSSNNGQKGIGGTFVNVTNGTDMFKTLTGFTVTMWVQSFEETNIGHRKMLFSTGNDFLNSNRIGTIMIYHEEPDNGYKCNFHNQTTDSAPEAVINDEGMSDEQEWHFVACRWNGTTIKVFRDEAGSLSSGEDNVQITGGVITNTQDRSILIGQSDDNNSATRNYGGYIDEFRFYNESLTDDEIYQIYTSRLEKYDTDAYYFFSNQTQLEKGNYTFSLHAEDLSSITNLAERQFEVGFVSGVSPCTCPGVGNWAVDLSENCKIEETCNIYPGNLSYTSTGTLTINATFNLSEMREPTANQIIYIGSEAIVYSKGP